MSADSNDEKVVYRNPPQRKRFVKGSSGNPRGRPTGSGNFSSMMDEILNRPVHLKVDGRKVVMTGREALGMRMVNRAVNGDVRMIQLLKRYGVFERADEPMIIWLPESGKNL